MHLPISGQNLSWGHIGLAAILVVALLSSCSRAPDLVGVDNLETPAVTVEEATRQKIFITTTRQATEVVGAFGSVAKFENVGLLAKL